MQNIKTKIASTEFNTTHNNEAGIPNNYNE